MSRIDIKNFFIHLKSSILQKIAMKKEEISNDTSALVTLGLNTTTIMLLFLSNSGVLALMAPDILKGCLCIPIWPAVCFLLGVLFIIPASHFGSLSSSNRKNSISIIFEFSSNILGFLSFLSFWIGISLICYYKGYLFFLPIVIILITILLGIILCMVLAVISLFF